MFIETKLRPPQLADDLVQRPAIMDALDRAVCSPVTALIAPAGYGKTTAVAQWLALRRPVQAWATLDRTDNDPGRLWHTLIHSLERAIDRVRRLVATDGSPLTPLHLEDPCAALLGALQDHARSWSRPDRLVWIWDDVHTIESPALLGELSRLLDYLPDYVHVILTARQLPELDLPRRQVRHQLSIIDKTALSFAQADIREWVNRRFHLDIDEQLSHALFRQTQGWAAAIQFTACRLTQTGQVSDLPSLTDDQLLDEYLTHEVYPYLPQVLKDALPVLAVFPMFSEGFCKHVLPQWDARILLKALTSSSLPCSEHRVDGEPQFSLHDLLRGWLRRRFANEPLADEVILAASTWYLNHHQLIEGLDLLAEHRRWPELSQALANHQKDLIQGGHYHRVRRILEQLPEPWVSTNPWVLYLRASRAFAEGNAKLSAQLAERAETLLNPEHIASGGLKARDDDIDALRARFMFLRAHLARWRGDLEESSRLSHSIDISRFTDQPHLQAWALKSKGADAFMQGASADGVRLMTRAVSAATESGDRICLVATLSWLIPALIERGEISLAEVFLRDARQQLNDIWIHHPIYAVTHYFAAMLHRERGQLGQARDALKQAWHHSGGALNPYHAVYFRLYHWWIHLCLGDVDEATRAASELARTATQTEGSWPFLTPPPNVMLSVCDAARGNPMPLVEWAAAHTPGTLPGTLEQRRRLSLLWLKVRLSFPPPDMDRHLQTSLDEALQEGLQARAAQVLLLKAQWCWQIGDKAGASDAFADAVKRADPWEMIQLYRDQCPELNPVLHHVRAQPGMGAVVTHILTDPTAAIPTPQEAQQSTITEPLSEREKEILSWLQSGQTNQAIADALHISTATVKTHLRNLYGKLGVRNRSQAVIRAVETGILDSG